MQRPFQNTPDHVYARFEGPNVDIVSSVLGCECERIRRKDEVGEERLSLAGMPFHYLLLFLLSLMMSQGRKSKVGEESEERLSMAGWSRD